MGAPVCACCNACMMMYPVSIRIQPEPCVGAFGDHPQALRNIETFQKLQSSHEMFAGSMKYDLLMLDLFLLTW